MNKLLKISFIVIFLAACAPVVPQNSLPPESIIATNIAATVAAIPTSTALPTATAVTLPTETAVPPTETSTPETLPSLTPLPTLTPVPVNTSTPSPTATGTKETEIQTLGDYGCQLLEKSPTDGTVLKSGQGFDGKWVILNTGKKEWQAYDVDIFYIEGSRFQDDFDIYDLPKTIKKGEKFQFVLDMTAPNKPNTYTTVWGIGKPNKVFCKFTLTIRVEKK